MVRRVIRVIMVMRVMRVTMVMRVTRVMRVMRVMRVRRLMMMRMRRMRRVMKVWISVRRGRQRRRSVTRPQRTEHAEGVCILQTCPRISPQPPRHRHGFS